MGSRLLGIPRRRIRQLLQSTELVIKPHSPPISTPPNQSPILSPYLRQRHTVCSPSFVDQILPQREKDDNCLAKNIQDPSASFSNRSLFVQDRTLWKQSELSKEGLKPWGQGPEGKRWLATYTRVTEEAARASTAATAVRYDDEEEEEHKVKPKAKEKDPSPEDCDEAVVGLSSAKAKHKQAQEGPKKEAVKKPSDSWIVKVRNVIIGIGPALRAIASMSRYTLSPSKFYCF